MRMKGDGVGRVVDHLQVGDRVLDLGALVELRPADHLVRDVLAHQHVLEHAGLRVGAVEDRDLRAREIPLHEPRDLGGDEASLGVLVLDLDHANGVALAHLAPEVLRLALPVLGNDGVRRAQNRVRRAVVLLERDLLRAAEVALEFHDVADVRAAEGVDGLVRVADREDVLVLAGEELQEPVLGVVRVLVLVHEHVAEGLLPLLARLGKAVEHLHGEHEEVVEVSGVRVEQPALVELVDVGDRLVVERRDAVLVLLRGDELVLRVGDLRVDAARDEALRVAVELLQALLHEPDLVGLVVNREVRAVTEARRFPAEDPPARRVEGHHPHRPRDPADDGLEPLAHLPRRLVREGDREDLLRLHADRGHEVGDAVGQHAGLSRARSGDDEHGAFGREHGLPLGGIQVREVLIGRRDGHSPSLASRLIGQGRLDPCGRRGERLLVRRLEHDGDLGPVVEEARVAPDHDLGVARASPPRGCRRSGPLRCGSSCARSRSAGRLKRSATVSNIASISLGRPGRTTTFSTTKPGAPPSGFTRGSAARGRHAQRAA